MESLGFYPPVLWMGLGGIVFFLVLGWILGKLNGLIERRVNLLNTIMAYPAMLAAMGVAVYVGYAIAHDASYGRLSGPAGRIYLIIFIPMAIVCAWKARSIAVIIGYAAVAFVGIGNLIWWIMGGKT